MGYVSDICLSLLKLKFELVFSCRYVVHDRRRKCSASVPRWRYRSALERDRCGFTRDETETFLGEDERRGMGQGWICCQSILQEKCYVLLNPMQLFQDHSMAWYRVMWKVFMLL